MTSKLAPPTTFVVDDDPSVLRATERLLKSAGLAVATFQSAQAFLDHHDPDAPGCLVLDVSMPEMNGPALQQSLLLAGSTLPIIFLTGCGDVLTSVRAMKSGAVDFLSKPCGDTELLDAIKAALARNEQFRTEQARQRTRLDLFTTLTPREYEVMLHVLAGRLNKQIAAGLGTVEHTIKVHRGRVMSKLGVESVADLVRLCERAGVSPKPQ